MKNKSLLVFLILFALNANLASAKKRKAYIGLNYGLGIANKFDYYKDEGLDPTKPKNSHISSLQLGYRFNKDIRAELAFNRFHEFKYENILKGTNVNTGAHVMNEYYTQEVSANAVFANFYFDINSSRKFIPYVNAGLGISINKAGDFMLEVRDGIDDSGKPFEIPPNTIGKGNTKSRFAWNVGAGLSYKINRKVTLDLINYKYYQLGKISAGPDVGGDYVETKLKIHSVSAGIKIEI